MVQEAWKAGATKCLSKANCTPKQVIEVVRSALRTNGARAATPGAARRGLRHQQPAALAATGHSAASLPPPAIRMRNSRPTCADRSSTACRRSWRPCARCCKALIKADNETARLKQLHELVPAHPCADRQRRHRRPAPRSPRCPTRSKRCSRSSTRSPRTSMPPPCARWPRPLIFSASCSSAATSPDKLERPARQHPGGGRRSHLAPRRDLRAGESQAQIRQRRGSRCAPTTCCRRTGST